MALSIRAATAEDLGTILELYIHLHAKDAPLTPEVAAANLKEIIKNPRLEIFIGEVGGEVEARAVVSCYLNIMPNLTRGGRHYGVIENVVTHPDHRRRGLGRTILQHALDVAWQAGCYKVMLMTGNKDNIPFYENAGFDASAKHALVAKPN